MTSCPSDETLGRLGVAIVEGPRFEELERHIEDCAACQSSLEELAHREMGGDGSPAPIRPAGVELPKIPGFVIEEELGRGSMGVVYRAWQPRLGRRVALKIVSEGPSHGARAREYWLREANSVARVRDPRVVQIHDVGEANGCLYLVLEYVPGGSLRDQLDGPLPAPVAAALAEKIAAGVAAVHREGLLHLDLKPSNILIDSEPGTPWESISPRVADFGIARDTDDPRMSLTSMRGPWGTPSYMAPEQVEPDRLAVGPASDVYALGAILYELLTGRPPFRAAALAETMDQIRHQDPAPPRRLNPGIPQDLETICTTCLAKDPKRRYLSVDALSADLRRWREGRPIMARPISVAGRTWRWARRRPLAAALGASLAATLILGILSLLVLWRQAERDRRRAEGLHNVARANYELASQSRREISDLIYQAMLDPATEWSYPPYLERALEMTQARQLELSRTSALGPSGQEELATLDLMLGTVYHKKRKRVDETRRLLHESIDLWESCIAQGLDTDKARAKQLEAMDLLSTSGTAKTVDAEIGGWDSTSTSIYRQLCGNQAATGQLFRLSYRERQMADYLASSGQADRAKRFLEGKLRLFESLLESHPDSTDIVLARALNMAALGKADRGSIASRLGGGGASSPGSPGRTMRLLALAELTARTYRLRALGPVSMDQDHADWDEKAMAEQASRFLSEQSLELGLDRGALLAIALELKEPIHSMAAHFRSVGHLEEARRTVRLYCALAEEFIRTCPGHAEPYVLLCEAHLQEAKNAMRVGDHATVGRSLRRSLEAAMEAQRVAPTSDLARRFVLDRRERLARHEAERSGTSDPTRRPTSR